MCLCFFKIKSRSTSSHRGAEIDQMTLKWADQSNRGIHGDIDHISDFFLKLI